MLKTAAVLLVKLFDSNAPIMKANLVNPRLNPHMVKLFVLCMFGIVLPCVNSEPITGKFVCTSENTGVNSFEFHADGTVDVTMEVGTEIQIAGKLTTVVKKETTRKKYIASPIDNAVKLLKNSLPEEHDFKQMITSLLEYKEKKYEQAIIIGQYVLVIKGKEIVSVEFGHIYKKSWW